MSVRRRRRLHRTRHLANRWTALCFMENHQGVREWQLPTCSVHRLRPSTSPCTCRCCGGTSSSMSCHSQLGACCSLQDVLPAIRAAFGRSMGMRIVRAHDSPCSESTCSPWTVHDEWSTKWQHSPSPHATSYACIRLYVSVYYLCASPGRVGLAAAAVRARRYGPK